MCVEQEAEVEEERLRKEREERDRQDAMTLGETNEQIQLMSTRLEELKGEKQQLFLHLKKVLNEDEIRKKQQQQKDRCQLFFLFLQLFFCIILLNNILFLKRNVSNTKLTYTTTTAFTNDIATTSSPSTDYAKSNC